jgi:hypothetical protein
MKEEHKCDGKLNYVKIVQLEDGRWYLWNSISREHISIDYCPYCGVKLEIKELDF